MDALSTWDPIRKEASQSIFDDTDKKSCSV